jgi:hypothetical protein
MIGEMETPVPERKELVDATGRENDPEVKGTSHEGPIYE